MPLPVLPPRAADSHKGDFGRAILIGGSRGMAGAISLAGMGALRGGAGLVRLAVPNACADVVASFEPSYTTIPLPCDDQGRLQFRPAMFQDAIQPATCIAFGPGVGRSPDLNETANWLYTQIPQPMVIDADGLNALSDRLEPLASPGGPRILTPHPGEFARLAKLTQPLDWDSQARLASEMAARFGVVIVLKGSRSLITNGTRNVRNLTGNPGMATGGSGDVLTGLITALVCQGLSPFDAAYLGCHVHGLAGDLAAEKFGQVSLIARDLIDFLPGAFRQLAASSGS